MITKNNKSFAIEVQDGVAIVTLDYQKGAMNIMAMDLLAEFESMLDEVATNSEAKAAVIISGKDHFIAGADIKSFLGFEPGEGAIEGRKGHVMLQRIAASEKPFVAAINGACMGGGTELSLACHGRVITKDPSSIMGLPEVKLGLLPGLGGTIRLPKLIGVQKALDMILTGKNVFASSTFKMGLTDVIVEKPKLLTAAKKLALKIAAGEFRRKSKRSLFEKILESNPLTRSIIYSQASKSVMKLTKGNYPSPLRIIEVVKYGYGSTFENAVQYETKIFDELLHTPEALQLINIFFAMTDLKKNPKKELARKVKTVGVLGAGLMGEGITEVTVQKGIPVMLKDINQDTLSGAKKNIWKTLNKKVKRRIIKKTESQKILNHIMPTLTYDGFEKVDIVIEAVLEDLNLKHIVLNQTEKCISDQSIFATNTSALPISQIAEKAKIPERVIGMHYFSPVPKMPLLEIITTDKTADWVTATALDLGIKQGKTCIVVKDGPGFYTTRILAPFMNEALLMINEGADIKTVDKALTKFGFPVGPVTLMDEVGIDVGAHINDGALGKFFESRGQEKNDIMNRMAHKDFKGRKNGKGFWKYDNKTGKKLDVINSDVYQFFGNKIKKSFEDSQIQDRLLMIMINEAVLCLDEGIIASPRDGDIGAVFGLGFPPFLGGPFRYLDSIGLKTAHEKLKKLSFEVGLRFDPCKRIVEMAAASKSFY